MLMMILSMFMSAPAQACDDDQVYYTYDAYTGQYVPVQIQAPAPPPPRLVYAGRPANRATTVVYAPRPQTQVVYYVRRPVPPRTTIAVGISTPAVQFNYQMVVPPPRPRPVQQTSTVVHRRVVRHN